MSNKHYAVVTLNEMKEELKSEKGWRLKTEPNSREFIFEFPLSTTPHIIVRVCSSIVENELSRKCGKDAIRVFAYDIKNGKGWIKTRRVNRIGTWRKNLKAAVMDVFCQAKARRAR
jgi:hypothetical protein